METEKEVLLKSLHICLRLPILIFDDKFNLVKEYRSNRTTSFFYNYKSMLKDITKSGGFFSLINGHFNEMFLVYVFDQRSYLFGPFRVNVIDKDFFDIKMNKQGVSLDDREKVFHSLNKLPLYSLGDIRDILILLHYFFTGKVEDLLHKPLYNYVNSLTEEFNMDRIDELLSQNYDSESYLFLYENKILDHVKRGNLDSLKEMLFKLSNSIVPSVSGDTIRSEKNYSIIVFEKLAQTAIFLGIDVIE